MRRARSIAAVIAAAAASQVSPVLADIEQCERLFTVPAERDTCRTLWSLNPHRERTDEEMRQAVNAQLYRSKAEKDAEVRRDATAKQAEAKRAAAAKAVAMQREADLKRGEVGFVVTSWRLGGFDTVMIARLTLQNNTSAPVKDFVVACETYGNSGTKLSTPATILYEALKPGERRSFDVNLGLAHSQSARATCGIVKWSPR